MKKVTEAIQIFLENRKEGHPGPDLVERYLEHGTNMETQVNVSAGKDGEPVDGKKSTWSNGSYSWWNVRIPKKANSEPEFKNYPLTWPLEEHAEGIGSTGWDWFHKVSRWVGFDFDAILSHAPGVGVPDEELKKIQSICEKIPWVEVRKSTGGSGIHLYVMVSEIPTTNHTEHAALARCILQRMSLEVGYDFGSSVDCCGAVLWLWHKKLENGLGGLSLIKPATETLSEDELPANWRDHVEVVTRHRTKVAVEGVGDKETGAFEMLASARPAVKLDNDHKQLIDDLAASGFSTVWVQDYHLLQTHTVALQQIHKERKLKGIFKTNSAGRDRATPNCFMFPQNGGGWKVYRFGKGIVEDESWKQDGQDWTSCFFNQFAPLEKSCKCNGGFETREGYAFDSLKECLNALKATGIEIGVDTKYLERSCEIIKNVKGKSFVKFEYLKERKESIIKNGMVVGKETIPADTVPGKGWRKAYRNYWEYCLSKERLDQAKTEDPLDDIDDKIRSVVDESGNLVGWFVKTDQGDWTLRPREECLDAYSDEPKERKVIKKHSILKPWVEVNVPFQKEHLDNRRWNRNPTQYACVPKEGEHPHWDMVLKQCFDDLTDTLKNLPWAIDANIRTGSQYGQAWLASCLQFPYEKLPYLFFYGDQAGGKSTLYEGLQELITSGVILGGAALINESVFNGEMEKAIIAVIEEENLSVNKRVYDQIKKLVTAKNLRIRKMRQDAYEVPSTLHFMQMANSLEHCPVFAGDTRIMTIEVQGIKRSEMIQNISLKLKEEAPAFLYTLLRTELPKPVDRFRIPLIETSNKQKAIKVHQNNLEYFISNHCEFKQGIETPFADFYRKFITWLALDGFDPWSRQRVSQVINNTKPYETFKHNDVIYIRHLQLKDDNNG